VKKLLLILLLIVPVAHAGNAVLTWELPTGTEVCTDNSTPPILASTQIWQLVATTGPTETTYTVTDLIPGDYTYTTSAVSDAGDVSRLSNAADKTVNSLLVNDDKAYTVVQSGGNFVAFIIGTIPVGTVCNANSMVKGLFNFLPFTAYGVPVDEVTITGDTEPVMVVATCH